MISYVVTESGLLKIMLDTKMIYLNLQSRAICFES